jgi:UDP-3-O-[3-hydroxymyristoyl] N-acetylglucosamine deacetylase
MSENTLKKEVVFSGHGIFTGQEAVIRLSPAPIGTGIVFYRTDIPGASGIEAKVENVIEATRCTKIGKGGNSVQTVEHLLAAIKSFNVDNLKIEISGPEVPIFDGSSLPFVRFIQEAGVASQEGKKSCYSLKKPLYWSKGETHLVALPSNEFRISCTIHFPHSPYLRSQYYSTVIGKEVFEKEIAPCRTFSLYEEVAPLIEKGILKGGGLENGVVIQGDRVLNPEGVRFADEMVRHKILDIIGDLALVGLPFLAHIIAIRSGHAAHHAFAKELIKELEKI